MPRSPVINTRIPIVESEFFRRDPVTCARGLIGKTLVWNGTGGRVVETEAYAEHGDEACHTHFRPSARSFVVENPAGTIYTYLNYGVHWLFNILVKDSQGKENGFVLLRALEPTLGVEIMRERRRRTKPTELCSGPGKLTQALGIDASSHGGSILANRAQCFLESEDCGSSGCGETPQVVQDVRIGISRARNRPWRFLWKDSKHVSVPLR